MVRHGTPEDTVGVISCGALAAQVRAIARRRGWPVVVYPLPPLLHNRPVRIARAVEEFARGLASRHATVAVAYADCGTYGALDRVCESLGIRRLEGATCYDVLSGPDAIADLFEEEPGTYLLTDFLVRGFHRLVWNELGLDRHPELRDDYFAHYRRVVWLAGHRSADLERSARDAAAMLGLPLTIVAVGEARLERALEALVAERVAS